MTYEEAKKYILANWFDGNEDVKSVVNGDEEVMAMKMAIEALEKQIPKKPKAIKGDFSIYYDCPYCRQYIATVSDGELCCGKKHIYCPVCGQRLLWDGDTE